MAHLQPIFQAMPRDRVVSISSSLTQLLPGTENPDPVVCSGWSDIDMAQKLGRPLVLMEHGSGQTYAGSTLPNYLNGQGRTVLAGAMVVNPTQVQQHRTVSPKVPCEAVGCPRLGTLSQVQLRGLTEGGPRTLVLAFRWDTALYYQGTRKAIPEARSAVDHWLPRFQALKSMLPEGLEVILHSHPRAAEMLREASEKLGWELVTDQITALSRASVWAQDNSSALWEACALGIPVIHLNAPWYRAKAQHGLRFWTWTKTGPQAQTPEDLIKALTELSRGSAKAEYEANRAEFRAEHYAFNPQDPWAAAARAAEVLIGWFPSAGQNPQDRKVPVMPNFAQEQQIEMQILRPHALIPEGEFWKGDRFMAGWRHRRVQVSAGVVVYQPQHKLGHYHAGARAQELEVQGIAGRA
jgi:hypothetical protein